VLTLFSEHLTHWVAVGEDRERIMPVMQDNLACLVGQAVAVAKITLLQRDKQKVVPHSNRPVLRVDTEMRGAGVSTGTPACPITVVVEVVGLVGRDGLWWRIMGVSVVTDFMFRSSPRWVTAVGLRVVEEESFTLTETNSTTAGVVVEVEVDGLVPRSLTVPPERLTREVEEEPDVIQYPALLVDRV
jgi:hypothetical protein